MFSNKLLKPMMIEKSFSALGTLNNIRVYDIYGNGNEAVESAAQKVLEIDDRMSVFKQDSDIAQLNRNASMGFRKVSRETFSLLKHSLEYSKLSSGAFDITIYPLVELWGIGKKGSFIPSEKEIESTMSLVGSQDLLLNELRCEAALRKKGQAVDLGGIAKGYAADEVKRILYEHQVRSAVINLGGNVIVMGKRPDGEPWRVGVQNPLAQTGQYLGTLDAADQTIVTSGTNERFFIKDGVRYHHILDPCTGRPAQSSLLSVTAICKKSMDADALSTALFILGPEKGLPLLKKKHAQAVFVTNDLKVFVTDGLKSRFTLLNDNVIMQRRSDNRENWKI